MGPVSMIRWVGAASDHFHEIEDKILAKKVTFTIVLGLPKADSQNQQI